MIFKSIVLLALINLLRSYHIVRILLLLEIIYLGVFIDLSFTAIVDYNSVWGPVFALVWLVIGAAVGLSLIVVTSRSTAIDYILGNRCNF